MVEVLRHQLFLVALTLLTAFALFFAFLFASRRHTLLGVRLLTPRAGAVGNQRTLARAHSPDRTCAMVEVLRHQLFLVALTLLTAFALFFAFLFASRRHTLLGVRLL